MKRRSFILNSIASSLSAFTLQVHAKPHISPIYQLLLNSDPKPINRSWFDSVGLLPIGHPAFSVTERSQQIFVDGNAIVQGNGTETSPYKDFYFLGGRNASGHRVRSRITINPVNTVIYVRGTFRLSDHQQDVDGSSMRIQISNNQMSNGSGGYHKFSAEKPLIFAPWPNQTGPVFDAQNGTYPESGASNGDDCPIHAFGSESLATGYTDLEFRGFTVKNGKCSALIRFHQGCRTARLISCHIYDGKPQSQSPAMSGGIAFEMSKVNANHLVDHCEIHNNAASVTNNVGEISWLSSDKITTTVENILRVSNNLIYAGHSALTGKHSGHSTMIASNNYIHSFFGPDVDSPGEGVYARGGVLRFEYNLFKDMDRLCTPDYQRLNAPQSIVFDHNTAINCGQIFSSTTDQPSIDQGPTKVTLTNNAFLDNDYSGEPLAFIALYDDLITPIPDDFTSANNCFGFPQLGSIFYKRPGGHPDLNYNNAMTAISDNGSLLIQPELDENSYTPVANGNCDRTGSSGTNIGAF